MTSPLYNVCTRCGRHGHCAASCKEPTHGMQLPEAPNAELRGRDSGPA